MAFKPFTEVFVCLVWWLIVHFRSEYLVTAAWYCYGKMFVTSICFWDTLQIQAKSYGFKLVFTQQQQQASPKWKISEFRYQ